MVREAPAVAQRRISNTIKSSDKPHSAPVTRILHFTRQSHQEEGAKWFPSHQLGCASLEHRGLLAHVGTPRRHTPVSGQSGTAPATRRDKTSQASSNTEQF